MCNPPFYSSNAEIQASAELKSLAPPAVSYAEYAKEKADFTRCALEEKQR